MPDAMPERSSGTMLMATFVISPLITPAPVPEIRPPKTYVVQDASAVAPLRSTSDPIPTRPWPIARSSRDEMRVASQPPTGPMTKRGIANGNTAAPA